MEAALLVAAGAVAVVVLGDTWRRARTVRVGAAEEEVFRRVNNLPDQIHLPVWAVMQAGSFGAVFVVAAALFRREHDAEAVAALVVGTVVWAGVKRLKYFVGRGRPAAHLDAVHVRGHPQTGLGYPSGHAAVSLTLAILVVAVASPVVSVVALAAAAFTGAARLYVGAHLPLDVAGGFAIGVLAGGAAIGGVALFG